MSILNKGVWTSDETLATSDVIATDITAEQDRYHLYISLVCPYAHRANLVIHYLGLPIGVSSVSPYKADGWIFDDEFSDPIFGVKNMYEIYQKHQADFSGSVTIPVLWDKHQHKIASFTSAEMALELAQNWQHLAKHSHHLVPNLLKDEIIALNGWLNEHITGKVYQVGLSQNQADYEKHLFEFFDDLENLNKRLANQRYLFGDAITLSDFFLFPTLLRLEKVYATLFKCSLKPLADFTHLYRYLIDLYKIDEIRKTVDLDYIVKAYFYAFAKVNPHRIVPKLPKLVWE